MNNNTLYTSVGHLQMRQTKGGAQFPVVRLNQREHLLKPREMVLWSRLCWRFRDLDQMRHEYESAAREISSPDMPQQDDFDQTLGRLMARGLIVAGEGNTQVEALYDLLSNLYVAPIDDSFWVRLAAASKLALTQRVPRSAIKTLLRKEKTTEQEHRILTLSRQALLSTAELIKCEENGVRDVSSSDKLLTALYYDDTTTSYNIAYLMRKSPMRDAVVLAVSNLYLRKQIVFQRAFL